MARFLYVTSYLAIATNTSVGALATALAAVPRDVIGETDIGLVNLVDVTTTFLGQYARRTMTFALRTPPPVTIATDATAGSFLVNKYTARFSQALSTKVIFEGVQNVPAPLPSPLLWVNAQYSSSDGRVADAFDLTGNTHDLVQAVGADQPVMNPSGFATNVATFEFDGTHTFFHSANALGFDEFTYLLTFQSPLLSTPGVLVERSVNAALHSGERLFQDSGGTHAILARRNGVVNDADTVPPTWGVDGNWHVATYVYSRASGGNLIVDGASLATFAGLAAQGVIDTLFVGAESGPALAFNGSMRELFVYAAALAPADIDAIARYMGPQVGLVV